MFASNQLRRCFEESREAMRTWGTDVGRRYVQRVDILLSTGTFDELYTVRSLRLHPLRGDREGQHTLILIDRWRLILTYLPDDEAVRVEEVSNHYGD